MKRLCRSALSFFCALALTLGLLVVPSSAAEELFFLSLNDTLAPQSTQTTPLQSGGWIYVPATAFSSGVTGVNFGVYYGLVNNNEDLVFYNLSGKTLTFHLSSGTATALGDNPPVPSQVLRQNGAYYVPAYAVCRYFGLTYSFHSTEYGPLLRIKDSNAMLSDTLFLTSAASIMRSRVNGLNKNEAPNGGGQGGNQSGSQSGGTVPAPDPLPTPPTVQKPVDPNEPVAPEIPDDAAPAPTFSLSLGVQASPGTDLTATLDALAAVSAGCVVFFPADRVDQCADQVRQAAGRGHKVGLVPAGNTPDQRLASVEQGCQKLAEILCRETWFVLGSDEALAKAGYLCWAPGLTLTTIRNATQTYRTLLSTGEGTTAPLRLLLHSQSAGGPLAGVLTQLRKDGDTFLAPRETQY